MEIFAIPISDPEGGAYTFKNKPSEFPLTASKAGRSSVKANGMMNGEWVKTSVKYLPMESAYSYRLCTPHQAVPEISLRVAKHIVK